MNAPLVAIPTSRRVSSSIEKAPAPRNVKVRPPVNPDDLGPVEKIRLAFHRRSRIALAIGMVFGAVVPLASYSTAYTEIDPALPLHTQVASYLVLGGLIFSSLTLFEWGKRTFGQPVKAMAFAVLLEGVMLTSHQTWLAWTVLGLLMFVNAVALACNVALPPVKKASHDFS